MYCAYKSPPKIHLSEISQELHPVADFGGLPGRARAGSRCCAPSCGTRSAPWAPPVPQRKAASSSKEWLTYG